MKFFPYAIWQQKYDQQEAVNKQSKHSLELLRTGSATLATELAHYLSKDIGLLVFVIVQTSPTDIHPKELARFCNGLKMENFK